MVTLMLCWLLCSATQAPPLTIVNVTYAKLQGLIALIADALTEEDITRLVQVLLYVTCIMTLSHDTCMWGDSSGIDLRCCCRHEQQEVQGKMSNVSQDGLPDVQVIVCLDDEGGIACSLHVLQKGVYLQMQAVSAYVSAAACQQQYTCFKRQKL